MMRKYGAPPEDMGFFVNPTPEMMFWLYCPIKLAGHNELVMPPNLIDYRNMVDRALEREGDITEKYVYLTAKTLHVTPENMGNRHGWHSDGFGTDDVNYIWSDCHPTEFLECDPMFSLSSDHLVSMNQMERIANCGACDIVTYPEGHILRLTPSVIHRVPVTRYEGFRSFAKVTISRNKFDLAGNSVNHDLAPHWAYHPRQQERNLECSMGAKDE